MAQSIALLAWSPPPPSMPYVRSKDAVLIALNGPSLCDIDYTAFDFERVEVWRSNYFFHEEKYYAGKRVDIAFVNPNEYKNTAKLLNASPYDIAYHAASLRMRPMPDNEKDLLLEHPYLLNTIAEIATLPYVMRIKELNIKGYFMTSGLLMIFYALAAGFSTIYVAGLDFYKGSKIYGLKLPDSLKANDTASDYQLNHGADEVFLELALRIAKRRNAKIYSVINAPHILDKAPRVEGRALYVVEEKGPLSEKSFNEF